MDARRDPRPIARARTASATDRAGRLRLRERMEALWARDPRLIRLVEPHRNRRRRDREEPTIHYLPGPLPIGWLPDGTRPLISMFGGPLASYVGSRPLAGLDDPLLGPLWSACLDGPAGCSVTAVVRPASFPGSCTVTLDASREVDGAGRLARPPRVRGRAHLQTADGGASNRDDLRRLARALGLDEFADYARLDAEEAHHRVIVAHGGSGFGTADLFCDGRPPGFDETRSILGRLAAFEGSGGAVDEVEFIALADEPVYGSLRPALNALATDWSVTLDASYDPAFDPFLYEGRPPACEAFRFPVASGLRRGGERDEPTLQVDVVHDAAGTHLEFLSTDGPTEIRRRADLGGVELVRPGTVDV